MYSGLILRMRLSTNIPHSDFITVSTETSRLNFYRNRRVDVQLLLKAIWKQPGLIYASLPCAEEISARISSKMVPPVPSRSCLMLMHPSWRRHGASFSFTLSCPSLVYVGPACPCCLVPVTCHQSPSNFTPPVTGHVQGHG